MNKPAAGAPAKALADTKITTAETVSKLHIEIPRACASCEAYASHDKTQGKCRFNPPKVFTLFMPPMVAGGMPQPYSISDWPIVNADQFCVSGYKLKKEGMI